jgi:hypothetical protein
MMSTATSKEFRRVIPADYAAILKLQAANFIANLSEEERKTGFLSAEFTPEQTAHIAEDLGTMGAFIDGCVAGFLCAFRRDFENRIAGDRENAGILRWHDIRRALSEFIQ